MDLVDVLFIQHPSAWGPGDFAKYLFKHRPDKATRRLLRQPATCNAFEWISETFESDAMRGLWAYWTSMIGPADAIGSGAYVLGFAAVHRGPGILRPRPGRSRIRATNVLTDQQICQICDLAAHSRAQAASSRRTQPAVSG